ncbi:hypothetical protein CSOJ01_01979 [Colletotrichum sojae]|uniref:Uncharacterized protein n=1 Tax=Colletotrichum sojae TaxID=2175907 RepID=A0A8H6JSR7_9PEZI|nr:hypothetical protein CSOJ01_01979 [Colletotrichum sojae]
MHEEPGFVFIQPQVIRGSGLENMYQDSDGWVQVPRHLLLVGIHVKERHPDKVHPVKQGRHVFKIDDRGTCELYTKELQEFIRLFHDFLDRASSQRTDLAKMGIHEGLLDYMDTRMKDGFKGSGTYELFKGKFPTPKQLWDNRPEMRFNSALTPTTQPSPRASSWGLWAAEYIHLIAGQINSDVHTIHAFD